MLLLPFVLCTTLAQPPQAPADDAPARRPRVGLVLSGGGARGAAHVGVLRFLEERRVPVDFVTGTSMGAIVGGLYCAGLSPDEIEGVLSQTDWLTLFDDDPPRRHMSWRRKLEDRSLLVDLEIGVGSDGLELPSGFIQGQKISPLFRSLTLRGPASDDFDQLRLPYRAIAMDVVSGETVVLARGDLAQAMRASMSIAGAFAPVEIDGRLLVDGGYVDNLPVDVAQELGAELVIAVDVGTPPTEERSKLRSMFAISSQVQDVIVAVSRRAARARLGEKDVLIVPELGDISFTDFGRAIEAVGIGYTAAEQAAAGLAPLSVDEGAWQEFLARQRAPAAKPPRVLSVAIENRSSLSTRTLEAYVSVRAGDLLDPEVVRIDLERLYGLGIFESADFRLVHHDDGVDLVYVVREKDWGPNYLRFGLGLTEDFSGYSAYEIGVGVTVAPINEYGAEWRTEFRIGRSLGVASEFYQPLDRGLRWFTALSGTIQRQQLDLDRGSASEIEYTLDHSAIGADFGRALGDWGEARVGLGYSGGQIDARTDVERPEEGNYNDSGYRAALRWDTLDKRDFPLRGLDGGLVGWFASEDLGADRDAERAQLDVIGYHTWGKFTGTVGVEAGTSFDSKLPLQQEFLLGGFGRLSGLAPYSIAGDELALLRLGGYLGLGGGFAPTYAGVTLEFGNVWDHDEAVTLSSLEPSASVFYGVDTPLGPFILGLGAADEGRTTVFLLLGKRL